MSQPFGRLRKKEGRTPGITRTPRYLAEGPYAAYSKRKKPSGRRQARAHQPSTQPTPQTKRKPTRHNVPRYEPKSQPQRDNVRATPDQCHQPFSFVSPSGNSRTTAGDHWRLTFLRIMTVVVTERRRSGNSTETTVIRSAMPHIKEDARQFPRSVTIANSSLWEYKHETRHERQCHYPA